MRVAPGFTLIELLVALAIIALMLSVAVPHYMGGVSRAEEAVLKENLAVLRDALDKHFADTGRYPGALEELVVKRYLRTIPGDPMAHGDTTWVLVPPKDRQLGSIYDVKSAAEGTGRNGRPYAEW